MEETLFTVERGIGHIRLNRPRALNALSPDQFRAIAATLRRWRSDPAVAVVLIEGAGERAFSAGGDIRAVWDRRDDHEAIRAIFRAEYRLDRLIHTYPKPFVAWMDGIVMGGGAGISVNGAFRVATERTLFAMPEAAIGFFPDVGATHFLGRCPGRVGLYLGLSGARLGAADCRWAGLATHFLPSAARPSLVAALEAAALTPDPRREVASALADLTGDAGEADLPRHAAAIERCFDRPTLAEALAALAAEGGAWAERTLAEIAAGAPMSLAVIFRQLSEGRGLAFDDAIRREYRLACNFLECDDLFEGIRAAVIDKDRAPAWRPASLAEIDMMAVAARFLVGPNDGLDLDDGNT